MGIRKNGGRSCISMPCVWFCGERHKSVSAASMQQFTSLNQQRYVTAVVMFFFQFWSNYATFDFRSSVVLFPPFCHVVKSSFGFCSKFHSSVSSLPRLNNGHPACPVLQGTWQRILGSGLTRSIRPAKIPKIWTGNFCWMESALGRFPFDQIFRFEIPGIPCDEWNSIFRFVGLTNPRSSGSKFRTKLRHQTEDTFTFVHLLWAGYSTTLKLK